MTCSSAMARWFALEPADAAYFDTAPHVFRYTKHYDAPPERVWALVSDITNTKMFTAETFDAEWMGGATGPVVGARFRGHVRRNGWRWLVYWSPCTITTCEPGRDFAFQVGLRRIPLVEWSYHFEPGGDGTDVTESFRLLDYFGSRVGSRKLRERRTRTNINNMRATLERIKALAESAEGNR